MAIVPNLGAGIEDKLPMKLPIGVRAADTIYTSFIIFDFEAAKVRKVGA